MRRSIFIFAVLLIVGCSRLESGVVTDKEFIPAHTERRSYPAYTGRTPQIRFYTISILDKWYLVIQGQHKGKVKTKRILVEQYLFEKTNIGDFIDTREHRRQL
jgi:hypothetical protein